ncbi:hypothetical protein [Seonamhaeicola marinus]|uniref:Lipoprotein n=1 Tax=Seonamhaeicola marinus TaxID=1912246 RepID=A0A5D0I4R5_9FLAO|nr:hypothetical protein [Seonamhaeicola marinus]TYA78664.1 hypothetical protein FUA24_09945 [Seonamhaeicola marinus]
MRHIISLCFCFAFVLVSCKTSLTPEEELITIVKHLQNDDTHEYMMTLKPAKEDFEHIFINAEIADKVSEYSKKRWAAVQSLPKGIMKPNKDSDKIVIVSSNKTQLEKWNGKGLPEDYVAIAEFIKADINVYGMQYVSEDGTVGKQRAGFFKIGERWILIPQTYKAFF